MGETQQSHCLWYSLRANNVNLTEPDDSGILVDSQSENATINQDFDEFHYK